MPLTKGNSKGAFSGNVKELMDTYKSKGAIGTSKPPDKKAALRQALAIAYSEMHRK